jgi:hypothetical protein
MLWEHYSTHCMYLHTTAFGVRSLSGYGTDLRVVLLRPSRPARASAFPSITSPAIAVQNPRAAADPTQSR